MWLLSHSSYIPSAQEPDLNSEFIDPLLWFLWFKSCSEQAVHQLLHGANRSLLVIRCVGSPAPRENAGISTLDDHVLLITFREHLSYL